MKILFLTQWFKPEPMFKGLPFAKALQEKGHIVEVLTGFPNYPDGKIYPGYKVRFYSHEIMDGITVHRTFLYPSHDRSGLRRIINYISFGVSSLIIAPFVVKRFNVIYVYNLITLGFTALLLKKLYGCKIVYDVQDLWPESVANSGLLSNNLLINYLKFWSVLIYKQADKITVLSNGFRKHLISRGIRKEKISVIYNWSDSDQNLDSKISPEIEKLLDCPNKFNVIFAGTMGVYQNIDTILDAAFILKDINPRIQFILVGGGTEVERLIRKSEEMQLENVHFVGPVPKNEIGSILKQADALLVHLKIEPLFSITIPSKTQAYMSIGRPILMGVLGDSSRLIKQANCGITFIPENPNSLVESIEILYNLDSSELSAMGQRGQKYYHDNMFFDKGIDRFDRLFRSLL